MKAPEGFDIWTREFDPAVRSDHDKLDTLDAFTKNSAGITVNSVAGTPVSGVRTSDLRFTRSTGVWIRRVMMTLDDVVGEFQVGEVVTEATSLATGVIEEVSASHMRLKTITAEFTGGETLTGGTSGATAMGSAPVNVVDDLKGKPVYSYVDGGGTGTGTWSRVIANTKDYIDVAVNNLHPSCDRILLHENEDTAREAMDISA